ncbi:HIT-like protein [Trichoderma pleuroticola]
MLETIKQIFKYLAKLEWTEHFQNECKFCNLDPNQIIIYDELPEVMAIENKNCAGDAHWLIMPKEHIRDIENLSSAHLPLLQSMNELKRLLLSNHPDVPPSEIHSGYHRGGRTMFSLFRFPDTISVHHLHLHVIVRPEFMLKWFKYPPWLLLMWKSDEKLLREVEMLAWKER